LAGLGGAAAAQRGGAIVWKDARVALRDREERRDGVCQQPRGEVTRQGQGVAVQHRWVKDRRRGHVSEAFRRRARPEDKVCATREGRWGGERGRGQADVVTGHWGLPCG
jgi:hypothetical protein